ncbi:MAG: putative addiction module antidote protein [Candidatus Cloacimonetes bacterium]|nr:putative addiction module antidote protein [Candidatus Cloacimonadota bacterium]
MKTKNEFTRWDTAETLESEEDMREYIEAAFNEGDLQIIRIALNNVVRARSMNELAKNMDISRKTLHEMLSIEGNLDLLNAKKLLNAVGFDLSKDVENRA